ncbi:MAG: M28 family peptidase [Chlorobi bacterium]|nr:M28 family peptidase [Chlorobiota bacterium]
MLTSLMQPTSLFHSHSLCLTAFLIFLLLSVHGSAQNESWLDSLLQSAQIDIERLASSEMMGRGYTQAGHLHAASYIHKRFREIGLEDINGSYYQKFGVVVDTFIRRPELTVDNLYLRFGKDFIINPGNANGVEENIELVWIGSGLRLGKRLDEHRGKNLRGRVAVIETEIPTSISSDSTFDKKQLVLQQRIAHAIVAGAKGVLLLSDRPTYGSFFEQWPKPVFEVRREVIPLSAKDVSFTVHRTENIEIETQNVVGLLPGTGETDSLLIVCGHYDHLGAIDDSLFFSGANDNASGIALMLGLAAQLKQSPLRYNVLFCAFSGEEIGLRGSRFFVENPPVDLNRVRFLINLDMAASGLDGIMALGGVDFSEEFRLLQSVHDSLEFPELRKRKNAPNSDHWFILKKGVRGFYIYPFTGEQPYHHVDDTIETLQWETFERMFKLIYGFVLRM